MIQAVKAVLRAAVRELNARCLKDAAAWAAELLVALTTDESALQPADLFTCEALSGSIVSQLDTSTFDDAVSGIEDRLELAQAYFGMHEYARAASVLDIELDGNTGINSSNKVLYIRSYSEYMHASQQSSEAPFDTVARPHRPAALSASIDSILSGLPSDSNDAFILYLRGLLLRQMKRNEEARTVLERSVSLYPLNWSAWCELRQTLHPSLESVDALRSRLMADSSATASFPLEIMITYLLCSPGRAIPESDLDSLRDRLKKQLEWFPGSTRLRVLAAEWFTNCREFESAEAEFEVVRSSDPCCLDGMDVYSGILFTAGNTTQLCTLAQECIELDRFRAETCVVVGNYHALRKDHERAVLQFQRALRLNSLSQNTWTLLAHSFLELKNIAAAIEAHQRALLINEHHVPAWYGLGLIYETMELPHYAINYYQRAAALASRDPAMWRALGSCYQSIGNTEAAISSFKRAITGAPHSDLPVLLNIARTLLKAASSEPTCEQPTSANLRGECAKYYLLTLEQEYLEYAEERNVGEACSFLAKYAQKDGRERDAAGYIALARSFGCEVDDMSLDHEDDGDVVHHESQHSYSELEDDAAF